MNLELNVVRFDNEDVIATSCSLTVLEKGTEGDGKHVTFTLPEEVVNDTVIIFDGFKFKYKTDKSNFEKVDGQNYFDGMIAGRHLANSYVAGDYYHFNEGTKTIYACNDPDHKKD